MAGFCLAGFALVATFDAGRPIMLSIMVVALIATGAAVSGGVAFYMVHALRDLTGAWRKEQEASEDGWGDAALEVAVDMDAVAALVQLGFAKESAQEAIALERAEDTIPRSADAATLMKAVLDRRN